MTELKCKNCGAALVPSSPRIFKCEYCGTLYRSERKEDDVHYVQISPAKTVTLGSQISVSDETVHFVPPDKVAEFTMRELTHNLAKALAPYIKVETMHSPHEMTQIIRGTIRVVEPDFRF